MRKLIFFIGILFSISTLNSQEAYKFTKVIDLDATPVISQGNTGTCWSFSATSFIESEIIRLTGKQIDISEMYNVRNTYPVKAENFIMRQGKAQFSEGGLAHDVINSIRDHGLVPNDIYSGLMNNNTKHNHAEMVAVLSSMLKTYVGNPGRTLSSNWRSAIDAVLDEYLGNNVTSFTYEGKEYTPMSFLKMTKIIPDNYINFTSFTHHPFYDEFILNIPDNFSNGSFYNVPLDELILTIDHALENGYTVELDCDVSEKTFSSKDGVAVVPSNTLNDLLAMQGIYPEKKITQEFRQKEFENYNTTDDHLMHITGTVVDQKGNKYYMVKNSWGTDPLRTTHDGYVYFSEAYMKLKTISITLHKDGVPDDLSSKLKM
jgi:bleomycin hydrolase